MSDIIHARDHQYLALHTIVTNEYVPGPSKSAQACSSDQVDSIDGLSI